MPESTPPEQHGDIKLYNTEDWLYEDFAVGQKDRSIRRTISEGEEMGLVTVSYEVFKVEGELVLYAEHLPTVKYGDPAKWADRVEKR